MAGTPDDGLDVRLLGPVEVARNGSALKIGGPRQRALLALLAVNAGRVVSADQVVDELWTGESPDGADVTVRSYVSRLRAVLGAEAPIVGSAGGYALQVAKDVIDINRFESLVRDGEASMDDRSPRRAAEQLRAGLALWRGRPFGELGADGSLRVEADRLEELRLHALELRIEADLALGAGAGLVDELEALTASHPYREGFWRRLMLALYRSERQADALAAYHRAREALDEQLGIEPGEDLQALEAAILRHEVPPATAPEDRHNLPEPLTSFIGREAELAEVARLLRTLRLVTLTGVGGVGKTRLALEAARAAVPDFADGVVFVDLAPLSDASLLPGLVGMALDVREQPGVEPVERLTMHLRTARALLVLDNCEHLRGAVAGLADRLLSSCPGLRLLTTSREVLGVPGESDHAVPPLTLPGPHEESPGARESEAVRLFLARARAARPGLLDDDATIATVARICADLDGLPLGIELAAARARVLSPNEIATRLGDRFKFLVSWRRLAAARHRTLREAMDWSHDLLDVDEQRLLRELSVFAGGFTLDAVAAVSTSGDDARALVLLERLVEASLVTVDTSIEPTRYRILETVRQYGAERVAALTETQELRRRHGEQYTAFAEAFRDPLRLSDMQPQWVLRIVEERENLRSALVWARDSGEPDRLLRIAEAMWWFWWIRGELAEARAWLDTALELGDGCDEMLVGRAHHGAAGLAWAQGDLDAAVRHAEAAKEVFVRVGDPLATGSELNTLGLVAAGRGELESSRTHFEAALEQYRTPEVEPRLALRLEAIALDNLGSTAHDMGDDDLAMEHYLAALAANRKLGNEEGVAMNELHLAILDAEAGRHLDAAPRLKRALAVYRTIGFVQYAAETLEVTSIVANGRGRAREAVVFLGASDRMRAQAASPPVQFMARLRERETAIAREAIGGTAVDDAMAEGTGLPIDAAMARALEFLEA